MGTKRLLAPTVGDVARSVAPSGALVDLFSGMGSVARSLADERPVVTNDALSFTCVFARHTLTGISRLPTEVLDAVEHDFRSARRALRPLFTRILRAEKSALVGSDEDLRAFFDGALHVGNDPEMSAMVSAASELKSRTHYCLTATHFAGGYFSYQQAVDLDALRFAIDRVANPRQRDWLMAAWLSTASRVINTPGHTAQFLKPNTTAVAKRIRQWWTRDVWTVFGERLIDLQPAGTAAWRASNQVFNSDAVALLGSGSLSEIGVVYADPPYTRDQYSRFYHVYETMHRYDFPGASGQGRYRGDRFASMFSREASARSEFVKLFSGVAALDVPFVLSYPSNGLILKRGADLEDMLTSYFKIDQVISQDARHSTFGGSSGLAKTEAVENIYVCTRK